MASRTHNGGGSTILAFVLGAVLVLAIVIGWRVWSERELGIDPVTVDLKLPKTPNLPDPIPMPNPQPTPLPKPAAPGAQD